KQLGKNAQSDARDALVGLLLTPENRALLANSELGEAGQEIIGKIVGIIAEIQDHLVETKGSSDLELEEIIKDILETADRAYFGNVSSILPREVVLERRDARHFELMIPSSGILLERHGADRRPVSIVTDIFDQPYIFLGTTSSTDPLATCFRSANPSQRDSLLKGVTVALQKVADLQKSPPVLVLSAAKSDLDFLSALVCHVRKYTQFDFIGPVLADRYERGSAAGSFELSLETFRCSRLTRVSPDYAITLRGEGARTSTLAAKFAQFSAVQSRFNRGIADDLTALREYRLRQATKGPLQRAWDPVFEKLDALEEFQGYSVANVLQICSLGGLIGGLSEGRSLSNLVLAATYLATSGSLRTRADHSIIALVKNTELFVQRRGWRALEDQEDLRDDLEQLFTMVSTELLEKRAPTQIQRSSASDLVNRLRAGGWGPVREFE
ncbi:MAG: hypothetical protein KDD53_07730, partial [Bdellovibrionales bacterium]|nr:hypothetical protein [Bdellovibrionales bacterium]